MNYPQGQIYISSSHIILEYEYDDEEEFSEEMAEMYDELENEYQ